MRQYHLLLRSDYLEQVKRVAPGRTLDDVVTLAVAYFNTLPEDSQQKEADSTRCLVTGFPKPEYYMKLEVINTESTEVLWMFYGTKLLAHKYFNAAIRVWLRDKFGVEGLSV